MKIHVDRTLCEGSGYCEQVAPDLFHVDDDGVLELLQPKVPPAHEQAAEGAVRVCPFSALRVET